MPFAGRRLSTEPLRDKGAAEEKASRQIIDALFSTITNANFDDEALKMRIDKALSMKNELIGTAKKRSIGLPSLPEVAFHPAPDRYESAAERVGVLSMENEDIRSLKQMVIYGVKGAAAYTEHALNSVCRSRYFCDDRKCACRVCRPDIDADALTALVLNVGECGVKAMALLDKANTTTYGNPEITKVNIGVAKIRVFSSADMI